MNEAEPDSDFQNVIDYLENKFARKGTLDAEGFSVIEARLISHGNLMLQVIINQWYATSLPPFIDLVGVEPKPIGFLPAGFVLIDESEGRYRINGSSRDDVVTDNEVKWTPAQIWALIESRIKSINTSEWRVISKSRQKTGYNLYFPAGVAKYQDNFLAWAEKEGRVHLSPKDVKSRQSELIRKQKKSFLDNLRIVIEKASDLEELEKISLDGLKGKELELYEMMLKEQKTVIELKAESEDDSNDDNEKEKSWEDGEWEKAYRQPEKKRPRDLG
jgi:hypothetical protein